MSCAACALRVEKALRQLPGVDKAAVNFATEKAQVSFDSEDGLGGLPRGHSPRGGLRRARRHRHLPGDRHELRRLFGPGREDGPRAPRHRAGGSQSGYRAAHRHLPAGHHQPGRYSQGSAGCGLPHARERGRRRSGGAGRGGRRRAAQAGGAHPPEVHRLLDGGGHPHADDAHPRVVDEHADPVVHHVRLGDTGAVLGRAAVLPRRLGRIAASHHRHEHAHRCGDFRRLPLLSGSDFLPGSLRTAARGSASKPPSTTTPP